MVPDVPEPAQNFAVGCWRGILWVARGSNVCGLGYTILRTNMALRTFSLAAVLFFLDDPLNDLLEYLVGLCAYDQVMVGKGEGRYAG